LLLSGNEKESKMEKFLFEKNKKNYEGNLRWKNVK
jgi:hypothetical protein